jgi:anti-sigma regulatory factor (Ser/Thr protein kinase)
MEINLNNIEYFLSFDNYEQAKWIEPIFIGALQAYSIDTNTPINQNNSYLYNMLNSNFIKDKTYSPIEHIKSRKSIEDIANHLASIMIKNFSSLSEADLKDLKDYLRYLFTEIMNNVIDHSESPIGGFAMAQYYKNKKRIQFVVADRGIGFLENVRLKDNTISNEASAIIKALEKGFTATKPKLYGAERNAGYGLYAMQKIMQETNGDFVIISNDMLVRYNQGKFSSKKLPYPYKGVIVAFDFFESKINFSLNDFLKNNLWNIEEEEELY